MRVLLVGLCILLGLADVDGVKRAQAEELRELYRGVRATAMGNTGVAAADDEQAIFMNPAGLAGQKRFSINYVALGIEASTDIASMALEGTDAFSDISGDTVNILMGKNIFTHAQFTPTITMAGFGAGVIVDEQVSIRAENKALPQLVLGFQQTNGFQVGWGTAVGGSRRQSNNEFRLGLSGKLLWRRGGYKQLDLEQMITINQDSLKRIAGSYQRGYGFDVGGQFVRKVNNFFDLKAGLAYTDIGDTKFGGGSDPVKGNLSTGVSTTYHFAKFFTTFNYELRHLNVSDDWRKKSHLGAEFGLPFFRLYAGLNQAYVTYGIGFDAWLFKITAVSYAEELGSYVTQDTERRLLLQVNLKVGI